MTPKHPYRRLTDHLFLVSDALLLTVVIDAALILLKDLAAIPAAWIDPMTAFLLTMTLGSMLGAEAAWFLHRRSYGTQGMWMLTAGLLVAAPALVAAHALTIVEPGAVGGTATNVLVVIQLAGLTILSPPLVAGVAVMFRRKNRHVDAISIARIAGIVAILVLITFRFLPETQAFPTAAHNNGMLGLSTIAGALAVGVADAIRVFADERRQRMSANEPAPAPGE